MIQDEFVLNLIGRYKRPAFIDEVSTGAILGGVTVCAVMLPEDFQDDRVNDSKQFKHKDLYSIARDLQERLIYAFGESPVEEINGLRNIVKADRLAMARAVEGLPEKPDVLFIDGRFTLPETGIESYAVIRGDTKVLGIAAASILAKDHHDHMILREYAERYRLYDIVHNLGYRSPRHLIAIRKYGVTEHHRAYVPQIKMVLDGSYDAVIFRKYPGYWRTV